MRPLPRRTAPRTIVAALDRATAREKTRGPRSAFTLMELLASVAILGILLGLLSPVVQKIRTQASLVHCQNNLKQIGLALHAYLESHGAFPATFSTKERPYLSWQARILPYIEQSAL